MTEYRVTVGTGKMTFAGTLDNVFITLIGTEGKSERTQLNEARDFLQDTPGKEYTVKCPSSLGKVIIIGVEKEQFLFLSDFKWFCTKLTVKAPEGEEVHFPCYRWIVQRKLVNVREGSALTLSKEENAILRALRQDELDTQRKAYQWREFVVGLPHTLAVDDPKALPAEMCFSFNRLMEFLITYHAAKAEVMIKFLANCKKTWASLEDISKVFWFYKTQTFTYVQTHWKEDEFFGYQFLNGANPMVIQRCRNLPGHFPVTDDMVQSSLERGSTLATELAKGTIFLCDYKLLHMVPRNVINMRPQCVASPLCLLYKTSKDKMVPIAIQLWQEPGESNPIFLPSDAEYDWLLAKVYVRAADFLVHQLQYHLLRTHLLAEVYTVATLRNLPTAHPLYKLLIPHTGSVVHINTLGRRRLVAQKGFLAQYTATGKEGMEEVMRRAFSSLSYRSLCLPEDITDRGLEEVPNFYYRDYGMAIWQILNKYVRGVVMHFYPSDIDVVMDPELQSWIKDIFTHGFLERDQSGIPQAFLSVEDVVKFVTMVIFTMTAQHSAVQRGQFDFGGWMPNSPNSLQMSPPPMKGLGSEGLLRQTLPDVNASVRAMAFSWLLSKKPGDFVSLGNHTEELFSETDVQALTETLKQELKNLSEEVKEKNKGLELPYPYLDPNEIENSITI